MSSTDDKTVNEVNVEHDEDSAVKPISHQHGGVLDPGLQEERHLSVPQTLKLHWRPTLCCEIPPANIYIYIYIYNP